MEYSDHYVTVREFVEQHRNRWSYSLVTKLCREGTIGFCASYGPRGQCGKWMVARDAMELLHGNRIGNTQPHQPSEVVANA